MACSSKKLFLVTMITQITVMVLYMALRGPFYWSITSMFVNNRYVNYETFQQGSIRHLYRVTVAHPTVILINRTENEEHGQPSRETVEQNPQQTETVEQRQLSTERKLPKEIVEESSLSTVFTNRATILEDNGHKKNTSGDRRDDSNLPVRSHLDKQLTGDSTSGGLPTNTTSRPDYFQPIDDKEAWLYSAFFDHVAAQNGKPLVRVFGVAKSDFQTKVYCTFTAEGKNLSTTGTVMALPDSHGVNYPPIHLQCYVSKNVRPTHISVSFQTTDKPTNRLQIIYPGPRIRNFTVCYSVLHSAYNKPTQVIESIEMNRILGAEHFMVYNYSISPAVDQILRRYQEDGLVTVLQWQMPTRGSWYHAQVTALNDCFYRNRNTSRFVVVVDTDELIVPRSEYTWMELIHRASPQEKDVSKLVNTVNSSTNGNTLTGCFMLRSSHFTMDTTPKWDSLPPKFAFGEEEKKNVIKYNILVLSQLIRTGTIFPPKIKSKYIARPELVYSAGIHVVQKFIHFMRCFIVNESIAILHHYRIQNLRKGVIVDDISTLKYKKALYPRVIERIQQFTKIFT